LLYSSQNNSELTADYGLILEKTIGWFFFCNSDISLKKSGREVKLSSE